jgi:hypothetical protein
MIDDTAPEAACAEALLAGTVALMTAWAHPCPCAADEALKHRWLIARKLASNLGFLSRHPALSPPLRRVMAQAQAAWAGTAVEAVRH